MHKSPKQTIMKNVSNILLTVEAIGGKEWDWGFINRFENTAVFELVGGLKSLGWMP